ncbi:MAG TPA: transposase [Thermoanaerobaculia bacterium]
MLDFEGPERPPSVDDEVDLGADNPSFAANLVANGGIQSVDADEIVQWTPTLDSLKGRVALPNSNAAPPNPAGAFFFACQWALPQINAPGAWAQGVFGSTAAKVAVLDTGVDPNHIDLFGKIDIAHSTSVLTPGSSPCGAPDETSFVGFFFHGTFVLRCIAACCSGRGRGASRGRLTRQVAAESIVLFAAGGAAGLAAFAAALEDRTVWWPRCAAIRSGAGCTRKPSGPGSIAAGSFRATPIFFAKAARLLDLYHRRWNEQTLHDDEFVLCADEKTSIQARRRRHPTLPPQPHSPMRVEHEYRRCGAWAYLAAWDVHRAKLFSRCEAKTGIASFDRLVDQVMSQAPYDNARRVFWIVDNGSSHRGQRSVDRLQRRYPKLVLVHGPVHASWLNQIEIYFSIIQRKLVTPNDFASLTDLAQRLQDFERRYEALARPFEWRYTRQDLARLLDRLPLAA